MNDEVFYLKSIVLFRELDSKVLLSCFNLWLRLLTRTRNWMRAMDCNGMVGKCQEPFESHICEWKELEWKWHPIICIHIDWCSSMTTRGPKLERYADKMREILPKIGWLLLLYLVCVFMSVCLNKSNCYSLIYSFLIFTQLADRNIYMYKMLEVSL